MRQPSSNNSTSQPLVFDQVNGFDWVFMTEGQLKKERERYRKLGNAGAVRRLDYLIETYEE